MKIIFSKLLALLAFFLVSSCHPGGPESNEDLDIVYTDYDPDFSFSDQMTYAIPDSIILINDQRYRATEDSIPEILDPVYGDAILSQIRDNMAEMDWTEVERDENPDVVLLVTASETTNLFYNYDPNYWNWWYPGSFSGYGWYYPGYSPGYISGYRTGSLMIQMAHTANLGASENVPIVWLSVLNGILDQNNRLYDRFLNTIDQAFEQSPYLNQ